MRPRAVRRFAAAAALAASASAGCAGETPGREARPPAGAAETPPAELSAAVADSLTDAGIAALLALINGAESSAARAARAKLTAPAARAYADALVADHGRLDETLRNLPRPTRAPPQAAAMAALFHWQAGVVGTLPAGFTFDATFAATQWADHVMATDSLHRWHGVATNPRVRQAIATALPVLEAHLAQARALLTALDQRQGRGRDSAAQATPPGARRPAAAPDTARAVRPDT